MGKDSNDQISAIFNPRPVRVRAPSVVVTGDSPNSETSIAIPAPPPPINHPPTIQHSDSVTSSQQGGETGSVINVPCSTTTPTQDGPQMVSLLPPIHRIERPVDSRWTRCKESCCSSRVKKLYFGIFVTILVTITLTIATHAIKFLYLPKALYYPSNMSMAADPQQAEIPQYPPFQAPFFVAWFSSNLTILFFPLYLLGRAAMKKCQGPGEILGDILRGFRDRGFTVGKFINRSMMFCLLWLFTSYFYICSLKALLATDVLALFATNVACVYLLSWVILHEQFVGIRIVAVILCDTGEEGDLEEGFGKVIIIILTQESLYWPTWTALRGHLRRWAESLWQC